MEIELSKAEKIALKITQDFPNHTFAWKILSVILKNKGQVWSWNGQRAKYP